MRGPTALTVALLLLLLHVAMQRVAAMDTLPVAAAAANTASSTRWAVIAIMSPDSAEGHAFDNAGKFCSALDSALTLNIPPQNIIVLANPGFKLIKQCERKPYNLATAIHRFKTAGTPIHVVRRGVTVPLWVDVVTGNTAALPPGVRGVPHDASFLMLHIGAHGAVPTAVVPAIKSKAAVFSLDDYLTQGVMHFFPVSAPTVPVEVPDKSLLHATGFPAIPPLSGENRALTGAVLKWVLHHLQERGAHKPTVTVFATTCFGAALFNKIDARIDKTQEQASTPASAALAAKKRQLFEASPIPNTVVFTNALDYAPSYGSDFDDTLTRALKSDGTRTWKDVLTALKSAQVKHAAKEQTREKQKALKAAEPDKLHRLWEAGDWRLRAFGDATVFDQPIGERKTYERSNDLFYSLWVFDLSSGVTRLGKIHVPQPANQEALVQLAAEQLPAVAQLVSDGEYELQYIDAGVLQYLGPGGLGKAPQEKLKCLAPQPRNKRVRSLGACWGTWYPIDEEAPFSTAWKSFTDVKGFGIKKLV